MAKVVIFDFDGTLADTAPLIVNIYNKLAKKKGWKIVRKKDLPTLRQGGIWDAQRWAGVRLWQLPYLIMDGRTLFKLKAGTVKLFDGIPELIADLNENGYSVYILSRNKPEVVNLVLQKYGVSKNVVVLKSTSFFGGKHKAIRALIAQEGYDRHQMWMVGDETRDIEAARKAKVRSIAVTWGLQDEAMLKLYNPTKLAHTPQDIRSSLLKGEK